MSLFDRIASRLRKQHESEKREYPVLVVRSFVPNLHRLSMQEAEIAMQCVWQDAKEWPQMPYESAEIRALRSVYQSRRELVRIITQFLAAAPLQELSRMAHDAAEMSVLKGRNAETQKLLLHDRDVIEVLASAQRQLAKIRARYGE